MSDLISRQNTADVMERWLYDGEDKRTVKEVVYELPSAQPTQLTDEDKETIRIHLSAIKENLCNQRRWNEAKEYEELISRLLSTTSVHPDKDLIHLQKEQSYLQGYEDGRKMIRCKDCMYSLMED